MTRATKTTAVAILAGGMLSAGAHAAPMALTDAQMDAVAAGAVETVDGFVCPVIGTDAVLNSENGGELGIDGYYTIGGPDVTVPIHATNGDGAGRPSGPFSAPGDTDYTAIWGTR